MAHMELAAGIGKHGQAVVFFATGIFYGGEAALLMPKFLGSGFDVAGGVLMIHWQCQFSIQRAVEV